MPWNELTTLLALSTAMSFSPGPNTNSSTALAADRGLRVVMQFSCALPLGAKLFILD